MIYADLKNAVAGYAHRTDLTALMPVFLGLAEQRIYNGEQNTRPLRIRQMLKTASLTAGALPADFLEARRVSVDGTQLEYIPFDQAATVQGPVGFSVSAGVLALPGISQSQSVDLVYYARWTTPSLDIDTNWLLDKQPAVYLAAMLVEVGKYLRDDALMTRSAGDYTSAVTALEMADQQAQYSGGPLRMVAESRRPSGRHPNVAPVTTSPYVPSFDPADVFNQQVAP